jgi:hypothetical protein
MRLWCVLGVVHFFLLGCSPKTQFDFNREYSAFIALITGKKAQTPPKVETKILERNYYAQIVQEMIRVLLRKEPKDGREFSGFLSLLEQGVSLEGIYNGITHSSNYRELELKGPASPGALKAFAREMLLFQSALLQPTAFSSSAALPLSKPVDLGATSGDVQEFGRANDPKICVSENDFAAVFAKSSFFTLKRVLSDQAIQVFSFHAGEREKLATWYSRWAGKLAESGVDFGLEPRNRKDESFHYQWAMANSNDRVLWEVLNRINRVLNEVNP